MCHPVTPRPSQVISHKRKPPEIDLQVVQKAEKIFGQKCREHGIGSPIKGADGKPKEGRYKRLFRTALPDHVALVVNAHQTENPSTFYQIAKRDTEILERFQHRGHFPVIIDAFGIHDDRHVTIQENLGPTLKDVFLSGPNPHFETIDHLKLQRICKQLLESLSILHNEGFVHGDIKPDNCSAKGVLFDFGLSEKIDQGETRNLMYALSYRPPETVLERKTSLPGDMWALGCLFYELFSKQVLIPAVITTSLVQDHVNNLHAYRDRLKLDYNMSQLYEKNPDCFEKEGAEIKLKQSTFPREYKIKPFYDYILRAGEIFRPFADLLEKMLQFDPRNRITARDALSHPFFTKLRYDVSFKLGVIGNFKGHLRIKNHREEVLTSIDLSKWHPEDCFHIDSSSKPYILEFLKGEKVIHRSEMSVPRDRAVVPIDTTAFST